MSNLIEQWENMAIFKDRNKLVLCETSDDIWSGYRVINAGNNEVVGSSASEHQAIIDAFEHKGEHLGAWFSKEAGGYEIAKVTKTVICSEITEEDANEILQHPISTLGGPEKPIHVAEYDLIEKGAAEMGWLD